MKHGNRVNALLTEILLAVLFFALASTVLLQTFAAARTQSDRAGMLNDVLVQIQNLSERLYCAEDAEALLLREGFSASGAGYRLEAEDYDLNATADYEKTGTGMLRTIVLCAELEGTEYLRMPCVRYFPEVENDGTA